MDPGQPVWKNCKSIPQTARYLSNTGMTRESHSVTVTQAACVDHMHLCYIGHSKALNIAE